MIRIYHFTSREFLPEVARDGITEGALLLPDGRAIGPLQWLTLDPSFEAQGWARGQYRGRDEVRITVTIPKESRFLYSWARDAHLFDFTGGALAAFNAFHRAPENGALWFLYRGRIKPGWFRAVDVRPDGGVSPVAAVQHADL